MFTGQQVTGPVAPGQYNPAQVSGPSAYYPAQTDQMSGMFSAMMPMIMMVMMMAMIMPMMKGVTASANN
ncbi:MAG: cell division protein FtsH [Dehalococcoidales bacterium]|nr:cell division protein FtsH [Dehalococcoidales bacterium]